jgi:hypothetical protein
VLTGCVHKQIAPPLPAQAQTPNIYIAPPPVGNLPPMQADTTPPRLTDAKPAVAEEVKPKKKKRQTQPAAPVIAAAPPPAAADPPAPEAATLGELSSEGSTNTKQQQDVAGKLGSVERRLNDLPSSVADREQKQIAKVRLFVKEASDALKGGDLEGAGILATKAELLMDDIAK